MGGAIYCRQEAQWETQVPLYLWHELQRSQTKPCLAEIQTSERRRSVAGIYSTAMGACLIGWNIGWRYWKSRISKRRPITYINETSKNTWHLPRGYVPCQNHATRYSKDGRPIEVIVGAQHASWSMPSAQEHIGSCRKNNHLPSLPAQLPAICGLL